VECPAQRSRDAVESPSRSYEDQRHFAADDPILRPRRRKTPGPPTTLTG
jgi:hypothetical protein